jgi:cytochrome c peroxidase
MTRLFQLGAANGFTLFMGKAKCGTCHFMPLFNGVVPPHFSKMESEVIGVPQTNRAPFTLDADEGKYRFTQSPIHRFAFKTPTLRNIALTAPYMHNGVYKTLEEVVEFYDKGGGAGLDIPLPSQTLPAEPLHLTKEEKNALIQFLHSLTDK